MLRAIVVGLNKDTARFVQETREVPGFQVVAGVGQEDTQPDGNWGFPVVASWKEMPVNPGEVDLVITNSGTVLAPGSEGQGPWQLPLDQAWELLRLWRREARRNAVDSGTQRNYEAEITRLQEVQEMLQEVIRSTQDAISVVDEEGRGLLVNPAYTRLTGLTPEDIVGKPATVDIAEGESIHLQVLATGQPLRGAVMKVGPLKKDVVVHAAPIRVGDELKGSVAVIHDISDISRLHEELEQARARIRRLEAKYTFEDIVAESQEMQMALEQGRRVAETPATVLLRGESGTGKELFAHAIHHASKRSRGQFIRVNCAAIAESLLESELFGYEEGSFTGARRGGKKGYFEAAHGGTLFLDEVGEIPVNTQAKLLRVLQDREIVRVGAAKAIPVDVRVLAATNLDLEQAVRSGRFREDLYYRLNVVPIFIPPLRRRREDIPVLVENLLRSFNQQFGRNVERVEPSVMEVLMSYSWPGNVRELENVLGRAIINMGFSETMVRRHHLPNLPPVAHEPEPPPPETLGPVVVSLEEARRLAEEKALRHALEAAGGNKTRAAELLGISVRNLYYKLEKHGEGTSS